MRSSRCFPGFFFSLLGPGIELDSSFIVCCTLSCPNGESASLFCFFCFVCARCLLFSRVLFFLAARSGNRTIFWHVSKGNRTSPKNNSRWGASGSSAGPPVLSGEVRLSFCFLISFSRRFSPQSGRYFSVSFLDSLLLVQFQVSVQVRTLMA